MNGILKSRAAALAGDEFPATSAEFRRFHRLWRIWRRVLRHFSRRRKGTPLSASAYAGLHHQLLDAAERYETRVAEHLRPALQDLHKLVRPWLSQPALASADRELLAGLVVQARRVERRVFGRLTVFTAMKVVASMIFVALAGGVAVWGANHYLQPAANGGFFDTLLIELKSDIWRMSLQLTPYRRVVGVLLLMLVGAWWLTSAGDD